jgi:hypothetical protein
VFSIKLKEKADEVGLTCHLVLRGGDKPAISMRDFVEGLFRTQR